MNVAGVHLSSMMATSLYKHLIPSDAEGMQVVSLCVEDNTIRHNFFVDGQLRFSRMSRLRENSTAEDVFRSVRGEVEKTVQYLTSIRIIQGNTKITARIVCADDIQEDISHFGTQLQGGKVSYLATPARELCGKIGVKKAIDSYGRDSTPVVHEMLRMLYVPQLAPLSLIRFYILKMSSVAVCSIVGLWAAFNIATDGLTYLGTYGSYTSENSGLQEEISQLSSNYNQLVSGFVSPPSTIENMRSSVNFLNTINQSQHNPGKLMLFLSKLMQAAPAMEIDSLAWYIASDPGDDKGTFAFASSNKVYEVIRINGKLSENFRPEIGFQQYLNFVAAVNSRSDMQAIADNQPSLVQADGELSGSVDVNTDVQSQLNAFTDDAFSVRLIWDTSVLSDLSATN